MNWYTLPSIGLMQYKNLIHAADFYVNRGFQFYPQIPWAVSHKAMEITRPPWVEDSDCKFTAGGEQFFPVASAEQGFLQRKLVSGGVFDAEKCSTITPCFRNERVLDDLHYPYFLKLELIDFVDANRNGLHSMLDHAYEFLKRYCAVDVIENHEAGAGEFAFDIVSRWSRIELGSYGIREHADIGKWVYGTGCAEPRLSDVIRIDERDRERETENE